MTASATIALNTATVAPSPTPGLSVPTTGLSASPQPLSPTPVPPSPPVSNATQPTQPANGAGGTNYIYNKVMESSFGESELKYYIFEPDTPNPPAQLPLIVLFHGYGNLNPLLYRPWIDHLVKRGNLVVFPVYQVNPTDRGTRFTQAGITALKNAITELQVGKHIRPDLNRFSIIGYSAGGTIGITVAAQAAEINLPVPRAVMLVAPGGCELHCGFLYVQGLDIAPMTQLAKLPKDTFLLITTGENDTVVFDFGAKYLWQNMGHIPRGQRDLVTFRTDSYGQPPLRADHGLPTRRVPDAYMFSLWKLFDGLQGCASGQKELCKYALGDTPEQRSNGRWSDGTPVKELLVNE